MYTARPMRQSLSFEVYDFDHESGLHFIQVIRQGRQDSWSLSKHNELTGELLSLSKDEVLYVMGELLGDNLGNFKVHQVNFNWEVYK